MIDISNYPILNNHKSTLKETSKDFHSTPAVYMTESLTEVVNFDEVKAEYVKNMHLCEVPKSNDALMINSDSKATFIEFKNGLIDKPKEFGLRKKIYDSVAMLTDIISVGISYTRKHLDYILVYNSARNPDNKTRYSISEARDEIDRITMGYANEKHVKFGLKIFEGYCFENVYTYTQDEFEREFASKL